MVLAHFDQLGVRFVGMDIFLQHAMGRAALAALDAILLLEFGFTPLSVEDASAAQDCAVYDKLSALAQRGPVRSFPRDKGHHLCHLPRCGEADEQGFDGGVIACLCQVRRGEVAQGILGQPMA